MRQLEADISGMSSEILKKKNYLAMIENATKGQNWMFRNFYIEEDGREIDILENGGLSCAVFASSILYLNKLIQGVHASVDSTVKDMVTGGWHEIKDLKTGAVLVWEKKLGKNDGKMHRHIGFYMGNNMAISNDSKKTGFPHAHNYTYDNARKIEKIYWNDELND